MVSREDNMVMSSEDSSSPIDESELLELGLGLSLGGSSSCGVKNGGGGGQYVRILTAKDLLTGVVSNSSTTSSSCSSSTLSWTNTVGGTKRTAASVVSPSIASSSNQVVGWPPIRTYRMNNMVNQGKPFVTEEFSSMAENEKNKDTIRQKTNNGSNTCSSNTKLKTSMFVKVNMDGDLIGRKVDLNAHRCYESLARSLEYMFLAPSRSANEPRSSGLEDTNMVDARRRSIFLDGLSEFVLTYKDKEGDWMLVGDVPWEMFIGSVRRLRIMRTSEAKGNGFDKQT